MFPDFLLAAEAAILNFIHHQRKRTAMQSQLDAAITDTSAKEATLTADQASLANIETAIATATSPLAPAQALVNTDIAAFNASLDALSAAALAAKVPTA